MNSKSIMPIALYANIIQCFDFGRFLLDFLKNILKSICTRVSNDESYS